MREISKKNYIILALICIVSIMLALYLSSWHKTAEELKNELSILTLHSLELNLDELDTFLIENPSSIIYISTKSNQKLEKEIYEYFSENSILNNFVYIDVRESSESELNNILNNVSKIKINKKYSNLYIAENGKIVSSLLNKKDKITISKIKKYVEKEKIND